MVKIYTGIGDKGKTTFFGCGMVQKNDPHIKAVGSLDELNSVIGLSLCFIQDESLRQALMKIQHDLFTVGADLAGDKINKDTLPQITTKHIRGLEEEIDVLDKKLGLPTKFVLPGGTVASSFLHLCRTTTRRVERNLVSLKNEPGFNQDVLKYVNRLSDFFYVLARDANKEFNVDEQQPIYKYFKNNNEEQKQ